MEELRLCKLMAQRGLCSRREADRYIEQGLVRVDGVRVSEPGIKVRSDQQVELEPAALRARSRLVTVLLHKPVGYVSGQPEDGYEPAVKLIRPGTRFQRDDSDVVVDFRRLQGLVPAGRLDIDSTGLLVLTQDGRIARQLIGADSSVEKEYLVRVRGVLSAEGLKQLNHGLQLDGHPLRPAVVRWQNRDQLNFILREGRKRQIRRMCELVGLEVTALKRIRIGNIRLGSLPCGQWRCLGEGENF